MNNPGRALAGVVVVVASLLAVPTASFAQLQVITSGGFRAAYREVLPEFERTTGISVTTGGGASQGNGPTTIGAQLRRGVLADVVIMSREGLEELKKDGRIVAGTDVDLAQTPIGVALVATGEAEIALQPMSELLHVAGVDVVGTLPAEIQYISVFSAAVVTGAKDVDAAKRLIAFLSSEKAAAAIRNNGMEPSRPR